jgi:general stress protein 26
MSRKDNIDRVWDIIEKVGVCMLTTQFIGGLHVRPLEARPDRDAGLIFFVTDIHSAKEDEIEAKPDVKWKAQHRRRLCSVPRGLSKLAFGTCCQS